MFTVASCVLALGRFLLQYTVLVLLKLALKDRSKDGTKGPQWSHHR